MTIAQAIQGREPKDLMETIPCFACLGPEALRSMQESLRESHFSKDEIIMLEGEKCPGLFVVKTGAVKLYRSSAEGEEQIVRIVRKGGCFECVPLFDKGPNPVSAQALELTAVHFLPAADFQKLINTYPHAVLGMVTILSARLRSLLNIVEDFSFKQIYPRLAKLLMQLSEHHGETLVVSPALPLNQQHLACMLGCSRQLVNTSLQKLVKQGMIKIEKRRIVITNPGAMKDIT